MSKDAAFLEEFLADSEVRRHISNRLHVAPLPATADLAGAKSFVQKRHPRISAMLREMAAGQEAIGVARQAWELLPPDLFGSSREKESFGFKAVEHGLFAAISRNVDIDLAPFSREDVEVIKRWRREVKSLSDSAKARRIGPRSEYNTSEDTDFGGRRRTHYRALAMGAVACGLLAAVLTIIFRTQTVEASSPVRLGVSQPGFQVVEARLTGLQRELYGRTLLPYSMRSQSKKAAERLFVSGEADARAGRLGSAAKAFRESNAAFPTVAARLNAAVALLNSSKLAQAEQLLKSTLPDAERSGNKLLEGAILTNLGHVYRTQGRFDDADEAYSRALAIDRNNKYAAGEAADLNNLALVLSDRGKNVKGLEGFMQALSIAEGARADSAAADSHLNIALTLASFGRTREAAENLKFAADYYSARQDSPLGQAYYYLAYGQYMYGFDIAARFYGGTAPKEIDQMLLYSRRALELYESVSNKSGQALALLAVGAALRAKGGWGPQRSESTRITKCSIPGGNSHHMSLGWSTVGVGAPWRTPDDSSRHATAP